MRYKQQSSFTKYGDFVLIDLFCLELSFLLAYLIRHGLHSYAHFMGLYRYAMLIFTIVQIILVFFMDTFKNVLKRGKYDELLITFKQVILVIFISTFYLFLQKEADLYSRITIILIGVFYLLTSYCTRLLWKKIRLTKLIGVQSKRSLLVITTLSQVTNVLNSISKSESNEFLINGIVILGEECINQKIEDIEVVANESNVVDYVCRNWVDDIYIDIDDNNCLDQNLLNQFNEMGIATHINLQGFDNPYNREEYIEKMFNGTVLTFAVNDAPLSNLFIKRFIDICGGLIGCIFTLALLIVIGPIIKIKSPGGPVFFSQNRIGKNGKCFKIYKFRSMYPNSEERKKELLSQNEVADGMMFKMENDPRIIKGIGHFIRKTSIDEFPQFFNVLKGDMSLVGTRPPTVDEWEKYELHHRMRMAMRPGLTGMWQVSGRSSINKFEDVVKLDIEYITHWNLVLDLVILIKTIYIVLFQKGAR